MLENKCVRAQKKLVILYKKSKTKMLPSKLSGIFINSLLMDVISYPRLVTYTGSGREEKTDEGREPWAVVSGT